MCPKDTPLSTNMDGKSSMLELLFVYLFTLLFISAVESVDNLFCDIERLAA